MIIAGNGIYENCHDCGKLVKINKFFFGSLHSCLGSQERAQLNMARQQAVQIHNQIHHSPLAQALRLPPANN